MKSPRRDHIATGLCAAGADSAAGLAGIARTERSVLGSGLGCSGEGSADAPLFEAQAVAAGLIAGTKLAVVNALRRLMTLSREDVGLGIENWCSRSG